MRYLVPTLLLLIPSPASAQLPQARLDRITPLGGAAGSSVVVEVVGKDLDDLTTLRVDRPGFSSERLKPNQFRLSIPADCPAGTVEVRAIGKYGITATRLFAISRGLTEVAEKEENDTPKTAQPVAVDSVINGISDNDGDDWYRVPLRKGQRVVIDCQAIRLDSQLRATLVLSDSAGKELQRSRPYHFRTDPMLDFTAPADGDYLVRLHDATFTGGRPYRLVISSRPDLEGVFPQAVVPGKTVTLSVFGRNLPGGKPFAGGKGLDGGLDLLEIPWTAPTSSDRFDFRWHPSASAVKRRAWPALPRGLESGLRGLTVVEADAPVTLEREDNDTADKAQELTLPTVVSGRLDRPGDVDWYRFALKAGESVRVDLLCERLDLPGDPFVVITDDKGNEREQFDDHGITFNALVLYNRDPSGTFTAGAAGTYRLMVQDRYRMGGIRHGYVLRLVKPDPDFFPVAFHETNPDPTSPLVLQGGSTHLELCLNRKDWRGPVTIEAEGLPPGVHCPAVHVSPQTEFAAIVFSADAAAPIGEKAIRLVAKAKVDGKEIRREVRAVERRWAVADINTSRPSREICLAVRPGAPWQVTLQESAKVQAGGSVEIEAKVQRHGDFKGKVQLTDLILPPGFSWATTDLPEGKDSIRGKLNVAANVPAGVYSVALKGDTQVSFKRSVKESAKNVRVANATRAMLVEVLAAKK